MKMLRIYLITILVTVVLHSHAQTTAEVFQKVNAAYADAENISMTIQYNLYANYSTQTPFETSNGSYIRQGNSYYSDLLGITTVQNKKYRVSVSENDKTVIVSNPAKIGKAPSMVETDTLLKQCTSTEVKKETDGSSRCILHFEDAPFFEFDRIEIVVAPSGFISRMVLFYRASVSLDETNPDLKKEKPRLEIVYSNIVTNPVIKPDQFSEKPFINENGKQITATPAYSNYRILNHKK